MAVIDSYSFTSFAITDLPLDVAQELAKHEGPLTFDRVRRVGAQSAKALARHRWNLDLGVEKLSVPEAKELAKYDGPMLSLFNLKVLEPKAAVHLAKYPDVLLYDDTELTEPVCAILYDGGHF